MFTVVFLVPIVNLSVTKRSLFSQSCPLFFIEPQVTFLRAFFLNVTFSDLLVLYEAVEFLCPRCCVLSEVQNRLNCADCYLLVI